MVRKIVELRATSDEELIAEHDSMANYTQAGTAYYMDELERRSRERASQRAHELAMESHRLASRTFWLTVASTLLSVIAVVVSVIAIIAS